MISTMAKRFARFVSRGIHFGTSQGQVQADRAEIETQDRIVEMLDALPDGAKMVAMRDIHKALTISQPKVLRAVRDLEKSGLITVEQVPHDPLASTITLR